MTTQTIVDLGKIESYSSDRPIAHTVHEHKDLGAKLICFEPGQGFDPHHTGAEAFFLVVKGTGEISIGDEVYQVSPGQVVPAPPQTDHGIKNTGSEGLALLLVQSPNPFYCC